MPARSSRTAAAAAFSNIRVTVFAHEGFVRCSKQRNVHHVTLQFIAAQDPIISAQAQAQASSMLCC